MVTVDRLHKIARDVRTEYAAYLRAGSSFTPLNRIANRLSDPSTTPPHRTAWRIEPLGEPLSRSA